MSRKNIIEVRNVTMRFGGVTAVSELTMDIPEGSIVGLIGPNGAGKTTAFNVITAFYRPTEGEVVFAGRRITGMDPHRICALGMARTFQNIRLFYNETALENVMIGRHVRRSGTGGAQCSDCPGARREERDIRDKALELLRRVGLSAHADETASSLPYGAQRRLEIARALATEPKFLLLDEPAAGMNPQESLELMKFIRQIRDEFHPDHPAHRARHEGGHGRCANISGCWNTASSSPKATPTPSVPTHALSKPTSARM